MNRTPGVDRLLATSGALGLAFLAHVDHLPLWVSALFIAAVAWRLLAEQRGWAMPPRSLRLGGALAATAGVLANFHTLNGLEAGTALLTVMGAFKLTETRAPRDHAVLVFVGYLLCLASLLHAQSFPRLAWTMLAVWLLTAALARVHRPIEANTAVRPLRLAGRALALGLPLAALLFMFVPRLEGRFWAIPSPAARHLTGIDDQMSPGDIAELGLSDEPAFRAWFEGPSPAPQARYWRVLVLEDFDGQRWRRRSTDADLASPDVRALGAAFTYRIALEPTERPWLVGLDTVTRWPRDIATRRRAAELSTDHAGGLEPRRLTTRTSYALESMPEAEVMPAALPADLLDRNLALPADRAPKARALGRELAAATADPKNLVARVLERFRTGGYAYTLQPARLGAEPVDEFLFRTREGFCEHYASAFAVLMRAAGIPARVVVGYQGGEVNSYGGYLLVRQSSAHAWNEIWLAGHGWTRVDPTAAIAPDRIRRGLGADDRDAAGARLADWHWLAAARSLWDAAATAWADNVLNFNPARQADLLAALGLGALGLQGLAVALAVGFGLGAFALTGWLALELRPGRRDPIVQSWQEACRALAVAGLPRAPAEGPLAYTQRVCAAAPALAPEMSALGTAYVAARYLQGGATTDPAELRRRLRALRRALKRGR